MDLSFGTTQSSPFCGAKKSMQESTTKVKEFCKPHRHFSSRISQSELTKHLTSFSLRIIYVLRLFEVDAHRVRPIAGLHFHERARNLLVVTVAHT
jgi:hypothetical protein